MTDDVKELEIEIVKERLVSAISGVCQDIYKPIPKLMNIMDIITRDETLFSHKIITDVRQTSLKYKKRA